MPSLKRRLYVGNIPTNSSESAVKKKLGRFGNVRSVEIKQRSDSEGNVLSSFAFVDIETDAKDLDNCFHYFENELWHSHKVNVQLAKESFLERLKREQNSAKAASEGSTKNSGKDIAVDSKNEGRTGKLHRSPDPSGHKETFCASKDDLLMKTKASQDVRVWSPSEKSSHKSKDDFVHAACKREESDGEGGSENQSRGKALPMFGGTKAMLGLENVVVSESLGVNQPHNNRVSDRDIKISPPSNINNLPRFGETKTVVKCKNLPVSSGRKSLMNSEKCVQVEDSQSDSTNHKINKQKVRSGSECSDSEGNADYIANKSSGSRCNSKNQHPSFRDARSELKAEGLSKKVNRNIQEPPSNNKEKKSSISPDKNLSKPKNNLMAERKRMNALEERKKAFALQKEAVKKALSSIDLKNRSNKKIIFDEDENDQEPETSDKVERCNAICDGSKPKLFQDASDDEDVKNLESNDFKIKPQFEGRQGQKLLEIQARYGHDSRFNLDERFLESDEEGSSNEEPPPGEEDLNAEKDHQLNILQEMLGVDVSTRRPKRVKVDKRGSLQMVRFDPTNPDHTKYLVKEEDLRKTAESEEGKKKGKKRESEGDKGSNLSTKEKGEEEEEDPVPVMAERFYKVSNKLKESLRIKAVTPGKDGDDLKQEGGSSGFSLLQKFGAPLSDNEEVEYQTKTITRNRNEWEKNPFRYDSSEEEGDNEVETTKQIEKACEKSVGVASEEPSHTMTSVIETFYFQEKDPRLKEGLDFFGIKKTFEEMQEGFHERRADLKLIIKAKVRNNKRKNRPLKRKLGGARRHKKKMAMFGSKRYPKKTLR